MYRHRKRFVLCALFKLLLVKISFKQKLIIVNSFTNVNFKTIFVYSPQLCRTSFNRNRQTTK